MRYSISRRTGIPNLDHTECAALSGEPEIVLPRTAALVRELIRESELAV